MTARLLRVSSPIGKELDSLADDITFGLAPAINECLDCLAQRSVPFSFVNNLSKQVSEIFLCFQGLTVDNF